MRRVADVMNRMVVTLKEEDDLGLADSILSLGEFRHLPVVRDGKLVGLVTQTDLLRAWGEMSKLESRTLPAERVMRKDVLSVTPETPLYEAVRMMINGKYGCLPVVEHGDRLVGIVTETDMMWLLAELVEPQLRTGRGERYSAEPV